VSHLLDANTIIHHFRYGPASKATARMTAAPAGSVFLSSVVIGELFYGAFHSLPSHQSANLALVAKIQARFPSIPFDDRAAEHYGHVRAHLASAGSLIGPNDPNDLLIAATARANGLTLVTNNTKEFSRVPGLVIEDWL
jgi:tRNA(fMet)-specific endonuclease VapC